MGDYYKITTRITRATARVARTILHYMFYTINVYCMDDPRGRPGDIIYRDRERR